ncbi:MAG: hypothetical protein V1746_01330 [bacterium]
MNIRQKFFFLGVCGLAIVFVLPTSFAVSAAEKEELKLAVASPVVKNSEAEKSKKNSEAEAAPQVLSESSEAPAKGKKEASSTMDQCVDCKPQLVGVEPGWRPAPEVANFPKSPFSGVLSTATPTAFKAEFDELARQISGVMQIGMETAIVIQNRVVRQGERIALKRESEKIKASVSEQAELENELGDEPTVVFKGIDREKEIAKFALGETDIHLPIPSARRKIKSAQGDVFMMDRVGTATFLNNNGYFVAAASCFANMGEKDEIYVKTQFGTFASELIRKDEAYHLALCRTKNSVNIEDIPWSAQQPDKGQAEAASILVFDPQVFDFRPKVLKISAVQANPPWLVGCPMLLGHEVMGVLAQKDKKLVVLSGEELKRMFPEISISSVVNIEVEKKEGEEGNEKAKPVEKVSWLEPREPLGKDSLFFNPEKVIGLIHIHRVK